MIEIRELAKKGPFVFIGEYQRITPTSAKQLECLRVMLWVVRVSITAKKASEWNFF